MVCSVEKHEVPGLGGGQRDLDRLAIAHLADEDHLRRLAQRGPQGQGERRRVAVQLALMDGRLLVVVQELDRILDGQDVIGPGLVDQIDDRRQRRRLAGSGRPGDEHDAVLQRRDVGQRRRQVELGERRDLRRDDAHDDREAAALAKDVDAKARPLGQRVGEVAGALFLERAQRDRVVADDVAGEARGVGHAQHRQLLDVHARQLAVLLHLRRPPGREDQVADAAARVEHRPNHDGRAEGRRRGGQGSEQVIGYGRGIDGHHVSQRDLGRAGS